jgi:hypothetical protein
LAIKISKDISFCIQNRKRNWVVRRIRGVRKRGYWSSSPPYASRRSRGRSFREMFEVFPHPAGSYRATGFSCRSHVRRCGGAVGCRRDSRICQPNSVRRVRAGDEIRRCCPPVPTEKAQSTWRPPERSAFLSAPLAKPERESFQPESLCRAASALLSLDAFAVS